MTRPATKSIPQPPTHPLVGNAPDVDAENPILSLMKLAREYGPIYRLHFPNSALVVVSSQELVNELCDETRFDKKLHGPLIQQRDVVGDSLFTAATQEASWGRAHRILQPGFGMAVLRGMFPSMWDIADQLLLKWERQGAGERIDVADNMTRLTLDTIALCAFNYRFNSFYRDDMHPFVKAMVRVLKGSGDRARRPAFMTRLMFQENRQRAEDCGLMHQTADEVIAQRKKLGAHAETKDLLDLMLAGRDPETGEGLSDAFIRYQLCSFLVAGHETTSGLLTFTIFHLLENPETLAKARAEVDRVLGNETPRFEHLSQLKYIDQALRESLRLWPTAPAFSLYPYEEETTIGGGYPIRKDEVTLVLLPMLHRDPKVWGDDVESFKPERFAPEAYEKLPPNSWKPFGNGQRSCIGRPFALQEAILVLAAVLQRFDLSKADPDYKLHIKQTLTIKPEGFFIHAKRRNLTLVQGARPAQISPAPEKDKGPSGIPLQVLYGSNSGSAEAFAQRIATEAKAQGYVPNLGTLDSAVGQLAREGAVIIVAASYEGHPTDNAKKFVAWMDALPADSLKGMKFAVFGCGNKDWARTYQAIPKRIDQKLQEAGAERLMARGEGDARGDFFGDFDRWYAPFWATLGTAFGKEARKAQETPRWVMEFVEGAREPIIRQNQLHRGIVVENRELLDPSSGRSKRHLEIVLPEGTSYRTGDYLAVLPENPTENIGRALRRFELPYDAQVILRSAPGLETFFPTDQPVMAGELLASYVELGAPASRHRVEQLPAFTQDAAQMAQLQALAGGDETYTKEILDKRVSLLDLLERFDSCKLPFATFLQMLPPLKPRQYSISSSSRWSSGHCTITVAVLNAPAWSGHGIFQGVASTYLAHARAGMKIAVTPRPSQAGFHLPDNLETPIIMVGAGTGMAPFRGFLQERAIRAADGEKVGPALLFFGCGHPDVDFIYKDELAQWQEKGLVELHPAFSRAPDGNVKYVQHRLWKDRITVMALMEKGARIYVCGDGKHMAPAVREAFGKMHQELSGGNEEQVEAWLAELERSIRYTQDVFA